MLNLDKMAPLPDLFEALCPPGGCILCGHRGDFIGCYLPWKGGEAQLYRICSLHAELADGLTTEIEAALAKAASP